MNQVNEAYGRVLQTFVSCREASRLFMPSDLPQDHNGKIFRSQEGGGITYVIY